MKNQFVELTNTELKHLLQMLKDAADVLESYSDHEDQSYEIRETIRKFTGEMTYGEELVLEKRGEK